MAPVACIPKAVLIEPLKELEPVLMEEMIPARVRVPETLAVPPTSRLVSVKTPALIPSLAVELVNSNLSEAEALTRLVRPLTVRVEAKVVAPDIEAVPPTSRDVSVLLPALMPSLELLVISKLVETETPPLKVARPVVVAVPVKTLLVVTKRLPATLKSLPVDMAPVA